MSKYRKFKIKRTFEIECDADIDITDLRDNLHFDGRLSVAIEDATHSICSVLNQNGMSVTKIIDNSAKTEVA